MSNSAAELSAKEEYDDDDDEDSDGDDENRCSLAHVDDDDSNALEGTRKEGGDEGADDTDDGLGKSDTRRSPEDVITTNATNRHANLNFQPKTCFLTTAVNTCACHDTFAGKDQSLLKRQNARGLCAELGFTLIHRLDVTIEDQGEERLQASESG